MFRSLHMKLVLIMLLLITSLMAVVGAFLMTSVTNFYIDDFYSQMGETFGESNADFVNSLRAEAAQEGGVAVMQSMLETYSGTLGIDSRSRNYYILDAASGECLAASDELGGEKLEQTANLLTARNGQVGDESDIAAGYMDVAIPISGGDNSYIIYIRDNRSTVSSLNSELLIIILQALLVGLLISVLLSFLLSKTMINPIEKLTEGAERVASGDFSEKLEVDSTDEIGILTTTFNDMASVLHSTLEAVEDERNKLDTLFLHMTDGVVAYDRDGALIHCNPAASELLERSADECVYADLFEPLCPFETVMAMQRSDFVASELTVGERTVELYFAPFSDEERGGVLVVLHDVTQQRKAEERAKAAAPVQKVSLENLFDQIKSGERKELALIVKADVQGSVEAVKASLEKLSNDEVNVRVIHGAVGAINESDVTLAAASNAIIVGFNVRPDSAARESAARQNVDMRMYRVIYDAIDEIETAMKGMLAPKYREVVLGHAEVRETYKVSSVGTVAGCYVQDGCLRRDCSVRVVRDGIVVHEGVLGSLQRFKDSVKEVKERFECGLTVEKFNDIKLGDIIEGYTMEEIPR